MTTNANGTEERIELIGAADGKTIKRAQFEAFEFSMEAPGMVQVINGSHADPEDHAYIVAIGGEVPTVCECPAFEYTDGPCKHMVAVGIRKPVMEAASRPLRADRGAISPSGSRGPTVEDRCPNGQEGCCGPDGDNLPCFDCYLDREVNE